jgi:hypothetical protein
VGGFWVAEEVWGDGNSGEDNGRIVGCVGLGTCSLKSEDVLSSLRLLLSIACFLPPYFMPR